MNDEAIKDLFERHSTERFHLSHDDFFAMDLDQFKAALTEIVPKWRDDTHLRDQYRKDTQRNIYPEFAGESFTDDYVHWLESKLIQPPPQDQG